MKRITDHLNHDPQLIRLRKAENVLEVSGIGVILFGVWNVLQIGIMLLVNQGSIFGALEETADWNSREFRWIVAIMIGLSMFMMIWIRCQIGISASREAEGTAQKEKKMYLVLAAVTAVSSLCNLAADLYLVVHGTAVLVSFAAILFELVSMLTSVQLILAAMTVRRIRREQAALEEPGSFVGTAE